ncbi:hypothetical protein [Noviherbaspirillum saxi]|uniref:Uncharacterized protein n=1 Tax=Noviherbaspirillum saxi TaxID=2320863 RepID=A0A3A3FKI6_9BURK|nr:hypothetical protein [Noviherbaspirillum saxi]RJF95231.1 hypothetical protein D3871_17455 [Noviherbaspirillum saxi]
MVNVDVWSEQYVVGCFPYFLVEPISRGAFRFVKRIPTVDKPNRRSRNIVVIVTPFVAAALATASTDRAEKMGHRAIRQIQEAMATTDLGEVGDDPIIINIGEGVLA